MAADSAASARSLQLTRVSSQRELHTHSAGMWPRLPLPDFLMTWVGAQAPGYMTEAIGFVRPFTYRVNPIGALELSQ